MFFSSVDGGWSDWLPWSPCSASCEGGTQNTSRECTNPPPNDYGQPCHGEKTKQEPCNSQDCPGMYFLLCSPCLKGEVHPDINFVLIKAEKERNKLVKV